MKYLKKEQDDLCSFPEVWEIALNTKITQQSVSDVLKSLAMKHGLIVRKQIQKSNGLIDYVYDFKESEVDPEDNKKYLKIESHKGRKIRRISEQAIEIYKVIVACKQYNKEFPSTHKIKELLGIHTHSARRIMETILYQRYRVISKSYTHKPRPVVIYKYKKGFEYADDPGTIEKLFTG